MKTLTPTEILEIQGTDPRYVSGAQLSGLSGAQLSWLSGDQLSWLSGAQLSGLSRAQLSGLSRAQLSGLSRDQLSGLSGAQLSGLSGAQLSGLSGDQLAAIEIIKDAPKLKNPYTRILEKIQGDGKLEMKSWHTCETTHCVGGWTVFLTPGGMDLEKQFDTATAARIILTASRPDAPLPNFTASNEAAMAFIEARAKEEAAT